VLSSFTPQIPGHGDTLDIACPGPHLEAANLHSV
jgi:hypothetical protein